MTSSTFFVNPVGLRNDNAGIASEIVEQSNVTGLREAVAPKRNLLCDSILSHPQV